MPSVRLGGDSCCVILEKDHHRSHCRLDHCRLTIGIFSRATLYRSNGRPKCRMEIGISRSVITPRPAGADRFRQHASIAPKRGRNTFRVFTRMMLACS